MFWTLVWLALTSLMLPSINFIVHLLFSTVYLFAHGVLNEVWMMQKSNIIKIDVTFPLLFV